MAATTNSRDQLNSLAKLLIVTAVSIFLPMTSVESIIVREVFSKFNFRKESGLLQYWQCSTSPNSEDIGCNLMLSEQTYISTWDHRELEDYRRRCLENQYPFVGLGTNVGNWLAGRAAQTRIADHRTKHFVPNQEDQHSADIGGKGQLVLPVYYNQGDGRKLGGIIEFVTPVPKESYVEYFEQLHRLLRIQGLESTFMGKTIKVEYLDDIIKFTLPLSAELTDLHGQVTERFPELKDQNLCIEYEITEGIRLQISSDEDLQVCMAESSLKGAKFIKIVNYTYGPYGLEKLWIRSQDLNFMDLVHETIFRRKFRNLLKTTGPSV